MLTTIPPTPHGPASAHRPAGTATSERRHRLTRACPTPAALGCHGAKKRQPSPAQPRAQQLRCAGLLLQPCCSRLSPRLHVAAWGRARGPATPPPRPDSQKDGPHSLGRLPRFPAPAGLTEPTPTRTSGGAGLAWPGLAGPSRAGRAARLGRPRGRPGTRWRWAEGGRRARPLRARGWVADLAPVAKKGGCLPVGESNPGLPRDRRGYSPLY